MDRLSVRRWVDYVQVTLAMMGREAASPPTRRSRPPGSLESFDSFSV